MHQACAMRRVAQTGPSALVKQQQRVAHPARLHAPNQPLSHQRARHLIAYSALQDLHIKPLTPVQQSQSGLQHGIHDFNILPVADWSNDDFLMTGYVGLPSYYGTVNILISSDVHTAICSSANMCKHGQIDIAPNCFFHNGRKNRMPQSSFLLLTDVNANSLPCVWQCWSVAVWTAV